MEFLNNLWIAISTPNEGLINVILFVAGFVENFFIMSLIISILDISPLKESKIKFFVFMCIISLLNTYVIPSPYNIFINYIVLFILTKYLFKVNALKSLIGIFSSSIIFGLIGTLILNVFLTLFNITYEQAETVPIYRITYLLIMYILIFIITIILKRKNIKILLSDEFDRKNKIIIITNFILGFVTLALQITIMFYYINNLPILFSILSAISLISYFSISIYSLTRVTKLIQTTQALHNAEEYNKTLRIIHDNVRCFKHDFDNIITTIGGYVQTDDMEGLKKYYLQLQDDCQRANNLYMLNPEIINNPGIYSLLTTKYHEAEEKNIKINLSLLLDLDKLNMKIYEFTRILGILLDNSIDAASESDEKIINIVFRNEEKNNRQIILIENTYKDKNVDIDKIFDKGISGKDNHTGLGLWEVRKIIKKNNNLNLHTTKNDKYFSQQLEIYYN